VLWQGGEIGPANPAGLGIVWLIGSPRVGRVDTIHTTTHRAGVGGGMGRGWVPVPPAAQAAEHRLASLAVGTPTLQGGPLCCHR
jgi:hypothetical protein